MCLCSGCGPEPSPSIWEFWQTEKQASFVHAYDRHGVVESPLSAPWRARIAGRFRFLPL